MQVRYREGATAVLVDEVGRVERDQWVTVSGDLGKRLCEQGWEGKGGSKKSSPKAQTGKGKGGSNTADNDSAEAPETKEE